MDLSHAYSDRAPQPKSYLGIGMVVAIHLAAIYALSAGLVKTPPQVKEPTVLLPPIPETPRQPEPLQDPIKADRPMPSQVPIPTVPIPDWHEAVTITAEPFRGEPVPPQATGGTGTSGTQIVMPPAKTEPVIRAPGAVCSVMPKPELPALNWSGEAVLQVLATVRGGRVIGSDFRVTQGALDSKTKRSLQRAVESALAGYQCQGDAVFQQDFAFRLD